MKFLRFTIQVIVKRTNKRTDRFVTDYLQAVEIANSSDDKASCHHLGQYFEAHDNVEMAVAFFTKAHAYSNALRLAKVFAVYFCSCWRTLNKSYVTLSMKLLVLQGVITISQLFS